MDYFVWGAILASSGVKPFLEDQWVYSSRSMALTRVSGGVSQGSNTTTSAQKHLRAIYRDSSTVSATVKYCGLVPSHCHKLSQQVYRKYSPRRKGPCLSYPLLHFQSLVERRVQTQCSINNGWMKQQSFSGLCALRSCWLLLGVMLSWIQIGIQQGCMHPQGLEMNRKIV